jgi:hypothetical protein
MQQNRTPAFRVTAIYDGTHVTIRIKSSTKKYGTGTNRFAFAPEEMLPLLFKYVM